VQVAGSVKIRVLRVAIPPGTRDGEKEGVLKLAIKKAFDDSDGSPG
jgi:hypothetical protein